MGVGQLLKNYFNQLFGSVTGNHRTISTQKKSGVFSHEEYKKEIVRLLKAEPNDLTPRSYELSLYVPDNHGEKTDFQEAYGNEHSPVTEATLFPVLKNWSIREHHSTSRILVKLLIKPPEEVPVHPVELTEKVFSSAFELKVYVHNLQESNLVETLPIPPLGSFTVGRSDFNTKTDVAIGDGEAASRYPMKESDSTTSLLYILNRRAFTIQQHNRTYWGCQTRKSGQFIAVKNDEAKKTEFPLEYPERKALYKLGDYIVVFSEFFNERDRILFKIVEKQPSTS